MRMLKIYLETTLFNFYFDEKYGFSHEATVALFKEIANGKYEAYTSAYVIVKRKTKIASGNINALNGYRAVEILNPMEVVENEYDK